MNFKIYSPNSLDESLTLLAEGQENLKILAGGTDLILDLHKKKYTPTGLVDLSGIDALRGIKKEENTLTIGAMTNFTAIAEHELLKERAMVLAKAASLVGAPQIRNQGTIGGNIINASPAADTVPALVALDAIATIMNKQGSREMPLTSLLIGSGKTNLAPDELLYNISFQLPAENTRSSFIKFGRRNALAISRMSVAMVITLDGEIMKTAKIAFGAVAPNAFRVTELENMLQNQKPSKELFEEVIQKSSFVVSDKLKNRPSAKWKSPAIQGLIRQALDDLQLI